MQSTLYTYKALKKECLLHRHSSLRILPGKSKAEKEQYFEERVLPIVGVEHTQPKPDLPKELLDRIRTDNEMTEIEFNKIYQMVQAEVQGTGNANQRFDYDKIHQMPRHGLDTPRNPVANVYCFENPHKKSTITLDGKKVQLEYDDLRSMQLFQELPVWRLFGVHTYTTNQYLEHELRKDVETLYGPWALSLVEPQRFKHILINLYKYGSMSRCDIENLQDILKTIAKRPGDYLRSQFKTHLNEETLQNVITLLQFLQTPYEYNELFLSRAIVRLLLQGEGWDGRTKEPEQRVLTLFLQHGLVRCDSETVRKLIEAIKTKPHPDIDNRDEEYCRYESYLESVFPDAFTKRLRF